MPDFVQNGIITTLHNFGTLPIPELEAILREQTADCPVALILPVTAADMRADAFENIVHHLQQADYIEHFTVVLGVAPDEDDFRETCSRVDELGDRATVLWTDGPRLKQLYNLLEDEGFDLSESGKGRSSWTALGHLLSLPRIDVVAVHDCDIVTYDRGILARLCLPLVHKSFEFEFCKAFYARYTDRFHGRVARLLLEPLLNGLISIIGPHELLTYLKSFHYPLAGEFAGTMNLLKSIRITRDWGVEIGRLTEVFRNTSLEKICQIDICPQYEHKHKILSLEDATSGLLRLSTDILTLIFSTLARNGVVLDEATFITLRSAYLEAARDAIRKYNADSILNGLNFDHQREERSVEAFSRQINAAAQQFKENPAGRSPFPTWNRVLAALPDLPRQICQAADEDRSELA